jgi:Tfp pilus assembly protein PilO
MKNRMIAATAVAAVLILAVWWLFLYSPVRGDTSKVGHEVQAAKTETRTLETQSKQVRDLERRAPQIQAELNRLQQAVPANPDLASFIEAANQLGTDAGVKWVSISPAEPGGTGPAGTIQMAIQVEGGYFQVLDYLNRLENASRLVVIDQLSLSASDGTAPGATSGGEPKLSASLTARMFNQAAVTAPAASAGATTPTSVAGGGGIAASQTGQGN